MGYVYKYTIHENGKWYVGSHNGSKKIYRGSGLLWAKALKKYGKDSYDIEILYEGDEFRQKEEELLISLDAANDPMSYNMKNQSLGGTFFGDKNGMFGKILTDDHRFKCGNGYRGKKRPEHSKRMSGENNPMYGQNKQSHGIVALSKSKSGKTFDEIFGPEKALEIKQKLSKSQQGKKHKLKEVQCPHCKKIGTGPNMTRYHFNKCKACKNEMD